MLKLASLAAVSAPATAGCLSAPETPDLGLGYGGIGVAIANALTFDATDGLVGRWPLNGTGSTATDVAGGNDGALRGTPQQGVEGVFDTTAYDFGSSPDNYVEVSDASALRPATLSVGGWYRTDSGENSQTILQKADSRYGEEGYAVDVQTPNSLRGHVAVESGQASVNPWGVSTQDGDYHHVFMTWDGSDLVLYFDGVEVDRDSSQSGDVVHSDRSLFVGYGDNGYTSSYGMDGAVDDVRLYNRALTSDEVTALFENDTTDGTDTGGTDGTDSDGTDGSDSDSDSSDPSSAPTPVARWEFAETSGTVLADSAGSNDALVRGSPALDTPGLFDTSGIDFRDSDADAVEISDSGLLTPTTALSVCAWYRTASGANSQTIVQKADSRYGEEGYAVDVQTANSLRGHLGVESGQATVNPFGLPTQDGAWHLVVLTWDGEELVLYFDGEVVDTDSSQSGAVVPSGRPLYLGWGDNGYTSYYDMDGAMDDVRIYETALSATQVTDIYQNSTTTEDPEPEPEPEPIPNDEFGESGFGAHGYGGEVTQS